MPELKPRRSLARRVSRHWAEIFAPPYLVVLIFLRERYPDGWPALVAAAIGAILFGYAAAAYLVALRGGSRVPEKGPLLVWAGVLAMEIHGAIPSVALTRVVPAALFFALGYGVRAAAAVPAILAAAAWLAAAPFGIGRMPAELPSIAAMAVLAGGGGLLFRQTRNRRAVGNGHSRETIARSRALVLPWEEPGADGQRGSDASAEETFLVRRETELMEGIRRTLEGLLPLTGAAHVAYLRPSSTPGGGGHQGLLASAGGALRDPFGVPDTYVPVREAIVFRRPFLEVGPESRRYAPWDPEDGPVTGIAAVPVFQGDAVEGVLLAFRDEDGPWDAPVLPLFEMAAYFIGRDIERTRALHRGDRYLLREDWYHRMVRRMAQVGTAGQGEPEESLRERRKRVYAEAVAQIRRQAEAERVALIGTGESGKRGWVTWEETADGAGSYETPQPLGDSYVGWVIRTGTQRLFSDAAGLPRTQQVLPSAWSRAGERSFLVLPVAEVGGFRGAVVCTHRDARRFGMRHAQVVRDITEVMQLGLSHVERLEVLTRKANVDALTGLANRKAFLDQVAVELVRLDGRHPCAVIMADIDHFKRINDTYGHPFGDEVLRRVGGVLGKAVRKGDAAGRYGGEEFVLYLHMADPARAQDGAERFRGMVRQTKFLHEGRPVTVTASFGVSCAPNHGTTVEELIKRADEALYLSKQRGRDRVTVYPG
jgi:diguanylate cyclase (GGDEF)-like protein